MPAPWLRRSTNAPAGWSAGGGDTDWDVTPQLIQLTKRLTANQTATVPLPKGAIIVAGISYPDGPGNGDDFAAGSAGDVKVGTAANDDAYLTLSAVEVYTRTAVSNGELQTADAEILITAVDVTGYVRAGLEVILPKTKP